MDSRASSNVNSFKESMRNFKSENFEEVCLADDEKFGYSGQGKHQSLNYIWHYLNVEGCTIYSRA